MYQLVWCDRLTLERGDGTLVGLTTVFDMRGITWADATGPMAKRLDMLSGLGHHTPGLVHKIHVVNCPGWVLAAWNAVSIFMGEEARERTTYSKAGAEDTDRKLKEDIDGAMLPALYGGEVRDLDPTWCQLAGLDPEVHELAIAKMFDYV